MWMWCLITINTSISRNLHTSSYSPSPRNHPQHGSHESPAPSRFSLFVCGRAEYPDRIRMSSMRRWSGSIHFRLAAGWRYLLPSELKLILKLWVQELWQLICITLHCVWPSFRILWKMLLGLQMEVSNAEKINLELFSLVVATPRPPKCALFAQTGDSISMRPKQSLAESRRLSSSTVTAFLCRTAL